MTKTRRWWMAAVAAVALASAIGVGAVMGQETVPTVTVGTTLIDRIAAKLGIEGAVLSEAIKSSATDEIDERLAAGELTQEQADAAKERIANAPDDTLIGARGVHGHRHGFFANGALAEFLGVTADELRTALEADGATLATVAEANGKSRDELKAFLTTELQTHLAEAVAAGRITQEVADAKLAEKTANLDAMIDRSPIVGRFHGGPGGGRPFGGDQLPEVTPDTEQSDSNLG